MPLEATMVLLDNSEHMRNGDCTPTRMQAQHDAANLVCGSKTQQNPENTVGIITQAGSGVEVLCSPTDDMGKILSAGTGVPIGGKADLGAGLQIAQLALKHRKNKNGGQRVVVFVGSPVLTDEKKLVKIGKQLKKGNVAVDIVALGHEQEDNMPKLEKLLEAVNKNSNSHLVAVPAGVLPSDVLITSPVITGDEGGGGGGGGGMGGGGGGMAFSEFGGVDPNLDPELAIALRVSMEEARAEAESKSTSEDGGGGGGEADADSAPAAAAAPAASAAAAAADPDAMDEDAMLQQALMMSMMGSDDSAAAAASSSSSSSSSSGAAAAAGGADAAAFLDPDFVKRLVSDLPGVDVNDPRIQAAMSSGAKEEADEEQDDDDDKKKKKKKDKDDK